MANGNGMELVKAAMVLGSLLAFIGSAGFIVDIGISEAWDVVQDDDGNVSNTTAAAFGNTGGGVDFVDRLVVIAMASTILISAGAITWSRGNPKLLNSYISYLPVIGMAIGITEYSSIVGDMLSGDYTFSDFSDLQNTLHVACAGWTLAGAAKLLSSRNM